MARHFNSFGVARSTRRHLDRVLHLVLRLPHLDCNQDHNDNNNDDDDTDGDDSNKGEDERRRRQVGILRGEKEKCADLESGVGERAEVSTWKQERTLRNNACVMERFRSGVIGTYEERWGCSSWARRACQSGTWCYGD